MPAVSKKQERFMQAVANNPKFAKKTGVPQSVGREFTKESDMKTKKYQMGGAMPMMPSAPAMPSRRRTPEEEEEERRRAMAGGMGMKKGGMAEAKMMKKEGRGMAKADMQKVAKKEVKGHEVKMHGAKKMMGGGMAKGYKSGGGIDGCATKGKTKGTQIKMGSGGMMKKGSRGC
jgi:hypothetical protein